MGSELDKTDLGFLPQPPKNAETYHTPGLALRPFLCQFPITKQQIVMTKLSIAALANARKPGFSAFIFSDVKTPTGNYSAAYKQPAADDLG